MKGVDEMKFQLIIDEENEELITARVKKSNELTDRIENLVKEYVGENKIVAFGEDETVILEIKNIECVTVIDNKVWAITENGKFLIKNRLYEVEKILTSSFIRINKSSVANINRIKKFISTYSGGVNVEFKSGYNDYISRRCLPQVKRRLIK
ncbi:MAG: LytTR family transcriptional regulator [Ruminococcaceae bacterium]|nr:LytTR family transcriptional regulator [Oscillospiraceae bacterium]